MAVVCLFVWLVQWRAFVSEKKTLRRALLLSRGDWSVFVTRPLSATLLGLAVLMLIIVLLPAVKSKRQEAFVEPD